ncbi:regulatory signaling modulator protein AmpE [Salinisphaera sp. P385]|uniref:Regulatory signaling modulator protein AmpE n=1 Tax=Spectribacter acetivorans TaxID=3075603 RepID=A0ABU3BB65_9GAMM|nr:regulatory signaling modulator protein AmpE [Salinisphaera sp. P385]MDT0619705.1 regulatory signaling modulator protein AmpE [Salinisphaera sp. P385]
MTLIVIFAALIAERLLSHLRRWREYDWYGRYLGQLQSSTLFDGLWRSAWGLLLIVPPLLLIGAIQALLEGGIFSLLGLLFSVLVLVFALGPRDLWEEVRAYRAALQEDRREAADSIAADLAGDSEQTGEHADPRTVISAIFLQGHERVFGVLLWFFVLGPLGAAAYRLVADSPGHFRRLDAGEPLQDAALRLHGILAWVPQHLAMLLYGLAGSTDGALTAWRQRDAGDADNWVQQGWQRLVAIGCGALLIDEEQAPPPDIDERLRQAIGIVSRSLIILLAVLSAFTIGGWIT